MIAPLLFLSLSILIDLFWLGPTIFFIRGLFSDEIELYSMIRYTEFVVFFISFTLLIAMLFIDKFQKILHKSIIISLIIFSIIILVLANSRGGILAAIVNHHFFC